MERYLVEEDTSNGIRKIYNFPNNYGVSVIRTKGSYGNEKGLWELAVLIYDNSSDSYVVTYDTPITDNVLGWLTDEEVKETMERIERLEW